MFETTNTPYFQPKRSTSKCGCGLTSNRISANDGASSRRGSVVIEESSRWLQKIPYSFRNVSNSTGCVATVLLLRRKPRCDLRTSSAEILTNLSHFHNILRLRWSPKVNLSRAMINSKPLFRNAKAIQANETTPHSTLLWRYSFSSSDLNFVLFCPVKILFKKTAIVL